MKIDARDTTVGDLLKDFLVIPRFQRPYDWEKEQVEQFWNDTIVENPGEYFIGSVVLYRHVDAFGIVDGQQRLTTIVLALCALRNKLDASHLEDLAKALQGKIERVDIDSKNRFVLTTETSFPYLQDRILSHGKPRLSQPPNQEEERLQGMFEYLEGQIQEALGSWPVRAGKEGRAAATLKKIRDKILGLKLIVVQLDNEDDAYLIFETLNTRGKDLQVSHLVKNLLTRVLRTKNKGFDPVKEKWRELHEVFESSQVDIDVDEFLHHFWLSSSDKYVAAKKMFVEIKKQIATKAYAERMLDDLVTNARFYRTIVEPGVAQWRKDECAIRRSLEALAVFRVRQPFPLVLSIVRAYRGNAISKGNAEAMLKAIERFHFTYTAVAAKSSSGGLSFMYAAWARQLFFAGTQATKQKVVKDVVTGLRERLPSYADFVAGFGAIRYSDELTKQKKLVQYILRKISDCCSGAGVATDHDQMTIEHIASQNPADMGVNVSPDSVAKLGNLLWCNSSLQEQLKNRPFAQKRDILKRTLVAGKDEVVSATRWTDEEIDHRGNALASLSYEGIWK